MISPDPTGTSVLKLERSGIRLITASFAILLALMLYTAMQGSYLFAALPLALICVGAVVWCIPHPHAGIIVLTIGSIAVLDNTEGFQITEILYSFYFVAFLGYWFVSRVSQGSFSSLLDAPTKAMLLFLGAIPLTLPLTILAGGDLLQAFKELYALYWLLALFPIREYCSRYKNGIRTIISCFVIVGILLSAKNLFDYVTGIGAYEYLWQLERGRIVAHAFPLFFIGMIASILAATAEGRNKILASQIFLTAMVGSLILTQYRSLWVTYLVGVAILFVALSTKQRFRLLSSLVACGAFVLLAGWLVIGDTLFVIIGGLASRFASLQGATTQDLSLVNRFYEAKEVLDLIEKSPILGHGMGVPYRFQDATRSLTRYWSFTHNGYLSLYLKFGLWGFSLALFFWIGSAWTAVRTLRHKVQSYWTRVGALLSFTYLVVLALPVFVVNGWYTDEMLFIMAAAAGIGAGSLDRARWVEKVGNEPT